MSANSGKYKLVYDVTAVNDSDNVGVFVKAGSDGHPITWTNVGLTAASYTGTPAGASTPVTITADNGGTAGNVTLTGDGVKDIATLISDWNTANPTNTLTLTSGIGTQVPNNGATMILTGGANGKDGLDVNIINSVTTTDASDKAEDSAHVSGDTGSFILGVRNDNDATLTSADGDYSPLAVDQYGRLKTVTDLDVDFDFVYAEDSAHSSGDLGAFTLGVRQATLADSVSADGDYAAFKLNDRGAMWTAPVGTVADDAEDTENPVKIGSKSKWGALAALSADGDRADLISDKYRRVYVNNGANISVKPNAVSVSTSAVALPTTALEGRRQVVIQNVGSKVAYIGDSSVSSSNGISIGGGGFWTFEAGQNVTLYGITASGTTDLRVLELA